MSGKGLCTEANDDTTLPSKRPEWVKLFYFEMRAGEAIARSLT